MEAPVDEPPWVLVRALSWAFSADCAWMVAALGAVLGWTLAVLDGAGQRAVVDGAAVGGIGTDRGGAVDRRRAAAAAAVVTVPDTALVDWVPLTAPAEVLT